MLFNDCSLLFGVRTWMHLGSLGLMSVRAFQLLGYHSKCRQLRWGKGFGKASIPMSLLFSHLFASFHYSTLDISMSRKYVFRISLPDPGETLRKEDWQDWQPNKKSKPERERPNNKLSPQCVCVCETGYLYLANAWGWKCLCING